MDKAFQTKEMISHLYDLTQEFTKQFIPRYYKQYKGEPEDLASEYFCKFMEPDKNGQTLLDGFDSNFQELYTPEATYFRNYVKCCVQRKLIDSSRCNPKPDLSIDLLLESMADHFYTHVVDTDSTKVDDIDIDELAPTVCKRVLGLSPSKRRALREYFEEVRGALNPKFTKVFDRALYPVRTIQTNLGDKPLFQATKDGFSVLNGKHFIYFNKAGKSVKGLPIRLVGDFGSIGPYQAPVPASDFVSFVSENSRVKKF